MRASRAEAPNAIFPKARQKGAQYTISYDGPDLLPDLPVCNGRAPKRRDRYQTRSPPPSRGRGR